MIAINKIEYLSQRDPRWANKYIGNSTTTIGRMGCLITCLAMASEFLGRKITPAEIASNPDWFRIDSYIWTKAKYPNMSFRWREGSLVNDAENIIDMDMIKSYLAHGDNRPTDYNRVVLLEVANRSHWVLGLWETYDGDILAIDPWTGRTCEVLKTYGNITGAALMVRWDNKEKEAWQGATKPEAPDYF